MSIDSCHRLPRSLPRRSVLATALLSGLAGIALAGAAGCAAGTQLIPQRAEIIITGAARIVLKEARSGTLVFEVFNHTGAEMVIQRDAFFLATPQGMRPRQPGGGAGVFVVQPGGVREISLRYDLAGLSRGDTVALTCQSGLLIDHNPVPVEPIVLAVR
jgi:hypothetical protein